MTGLGVAANEKMPLGKLMLQLLDSVEAQFTLIPQFGFTWFRLYLVGCLSMVVINVLMDKNIESLIKSLSIFSIFFVAVCWFQFVSCVHKLATAYTLRLVPQYRRALVLLVCVMWFLSALLSATFLLFLSWFFLFALAIVFASSLSTQKERLFSLIIVLILTVIAICFGYANEVFVFLRPEDDLLRQIDVGVAVIAVPAGMLALLGVTRTLPFIGSVLWMIWIGAIFFSRPIFGMSFDDLLNLIYGVTTQTATHFMTAFVLFLLMMYGLLSKSPDGVLSMGGAGAKLVGLEAIRRKFSWRQTSLWQMLPGFDYYVAHTLKKPFSFQAMQGFLFGRLLHWTTMLWYASALALVFCAYIVYLPQLPKPNDAYTRIVLESNLLVISYFFGLFIASQLAQFWLGAFKRYRGEHQLLSLAPNWPSAKTYRQNMLLHFLKYAGAIVFIGLVLLAFCIAQSGIPLSWVLSLIWHPLLVLLVAALAMMIPLLKQGALLTSNKSGGENCLAAVLVGAPMMLIMAFRANNISIAYVIETIAIMYCVVLIIRIRRFSNSNKSIFD